MSGYYPGDLDDRHPYFNPPDPPECHYHACQKEWDDEEEGWVCPECKLEDEEEAEVERELDAEDIAYLKAEQSAEWEERHGGGL